MNITPFPGVRRIVATDDETVNTETPLVELYRPFDQIELASGLQAYALDYVYHNPQNPDAEAVVTGGACWPTKLVDPRAAAELQRDKESGWRYGVAIRNPHNVKYMSTLLLSPPPVAWFNHLRVGWLTPTKDKGLCLVYFYTPATSIVERAGTLTPSGDEPTMRPINDAPWDANNVYYNADYHLGRYGICLNGDFTPVEVIDKPEPGVLTIILEDNDKIHSVNIGCEYLSRFDMDVEDVD
jgi:hypothetical protein